MKLTADASQNAERFSCADVPTFGISPSRPATSNELTERLTRPRTIRKLDERRRNRIAENPRTQGA